MLHVWESNKEERNELFRIALPCIVTNILIQTMALVDQLFVASLGADELAVAALSSTYFQLFFLFLMGFATALDTLLTQSFGSRDYEDINNVTIQTMFLMSLLTLFFIIGLAFAEDVMLLLQQEERIARLTGTFCRYLIIGTWPLIASIVLQKYLQAQNILRASVYVFIVSNIINVFGNYLLIFYFNLGLFGAPIATSISRIFQLLMMIGIIMYKKYYIMNAPIVWRRIIDHAKLKIITNLGMLGGASLILEGWAFQLTTFMAGATNTIQFDGHVIMLQIGAFMFFAFPFGIAMATSIRIGNLIGANQNEKAKRSGYISLFLGISFMTFTAILYISLRDYLGMMFVRNEKVIEVVARIAPYAALFQIFDGLQGVSCGIQRGLGKQKIVAIINFLGFWIVSLPMGYLLCFQVSLGVVGIWIGLTVGLFLVSIFHIVSLYYLTDWSSLKVYGHDSESDTDHHPTRELITLPSNAAAATTTTTTTTTAASEVFSTSSVALLEQK